ncbi:MAG: FAD binding domain-containing protein [Gemmatimonadetes bacterium]|nr:FAD binding domain-containing protein [Gemmatimonadota bacterium]
MLRLPAFEYHRPQTVEEAARLLDGFGDQALAIAGGTDVVPNMKHGLFEPAQVISLRGLPELRGIHVRGAELVLGAGETLASVAAHPMVRLHAASLAEAAGLVAGPQLRNMGTLGGNVCLDTRCTYYNQTRFWRQALGYCLKKDGDTCHVTRVGRKCVAAHSADTPPALMTLGASADFVSARGERSIPIADLFIADGIWNTVRRPDEILVRVRVPLPPEGTRTAFRKVRQRNAIDFPLLNMALACELDPEERVRSIRLVVSALGSRPRMVSGLDEVATGRTLSDEVVEAVAGKAHQQCRPLTNIIVDPEWRRAMVPVHVSRMLRGLTTPAAAA